MSKIAVGQEVYGLGNMYLAYNPFHYKKSLITYNTKKIIKISDDKKYFALDTWNGRYENWYSIESGEPKGWDDTQYVLTKEAFYNIMEKRKAEKLIKIKKLETAELKQLKNEIYNIENGLTCDRKTFKRMQDAIDEQQFNN